MAAALIAGCGQQKQTASGDVTRPLNSAEADLLAGVLYSNFQLGVAHFQAATPAGPEGGTITLTGTVDFRSHTGEARVDVQGGPSGVTDVLWAPRAVIENRPGLAAAVTQSKPGAKFIVRPVDRQHRRLDQVLEVVTALAAKKRENPLLLLQRSGAGFVRNDTLRGTPVELLRFGPRTLLWINPKSGRMLRFESSNKLGNAVVVVDLYPAPGSKVVPPREALVVPYSSLGRIWEQQASTSP